MSQRKLELFHKKTFITKSRLRQKYNDNDDAVKTELNYFHLKIITVNFN